MRKTNNILAYLAWFQPHLNITWCCVAL